MAMCLRLDIGAIAEGTNGSSRARFALSLGVPDVEQIAIVS